MKIQPKQINVVLFGYGKMGHNIYSCLKKNTNIRDIYVVDPYYISESIPLLFKTFQDIPHSAKLDAAFIASNSITHFEILKLIINTNITNIFCEKPMCLTQQEYDTVISKLPSNSRFVVDYLLRASRALQTFQKEFARLISNGYHLTSCNIDYGKDKTKDPRRFKDIGVYEELYHIWDLCFNTPLFGQLKKIKMLKRTYIPDPEIKGRCIQQRFKYRIQLANGNLFDLKINSSFQKTHLERKFQCFFKNNNGKKQILTLAFDKDKKDLCIRQTTNNRNYIKSFPANLKLNNIINDSIVYFMTGKKATYFHGPKDSQRFHTLMTELKQIAPLHRESIQSRIQHIADSVNANPA